MKKNGYREARYNYFQIHDHNLNYKQIFIEP